MSVTFGLNRPSKVPCPFNDDCEPTDEEMDAYFDGLAEEGQFNVANGNAGYILRDILGLQGSFEDICYGEMSADEFAMRLSMVETFTIAGGFKPDAQEGNVYSFGRTFAQCERYMTNLVRLSKMALAEGVGITWG